MFYFYLIGGIMFIKIISDRERQIKASNIRRARQRFEEYINTEQFKRDFNSK